MHSTDFTQLRQFEADAQKRFDLHLLAGCFADGRPQPEIPSRAVGLSLILGEVVHIPSLLALTEGQKLIAFTRFHAFAILHGKLFRLGKVTLQEVRKRIYRSLLCDVALLAFSG